MVSKTKGLALAALFMAGLACVYFWGDTLFGKSAGDEQACIRSAQSWDSTVGDKAARQKDIEKACGASK